MQVIAALEDKAVESLIEAICKEYVESYVDTARATRKAERTAEPVEVDMFSLQPQGEVEPPPQVTPLPNETMERLEKSRRRISLVPLNVEELIRLREARGCTQAFLSVAAGLSHSVVAAWETRGGNVCLRNLQKVAEALKVPVEQLIKM